MPYLAEPGTFSKSPACWGFEPDLTITDALGANVTLSTGEICLDWVSGLGSNLFGYAEPYFITHVGFILERLSGSLSLPSYLEEKTAERLCHVLGSHVPGWSPDEISARFAKTGSDVTTAAIRLARAVTNRPYILTFKGHYHGWGDWTISRTDPAWGILPLNSNDWQRKQWNGIREEDWGNPNLGGWLRFDDVAAVIFEVGLDDPGPQWYAYLRNLCDKSNTLLIVDEVVTSLRYGLGGACERYGIKPDLVCVGKALGNGLPVSALVGRREIMSWLSRLDPVFCSSTMWGEAVGLAAAEWVLEHLTDEDVKYIWELGERLLLESRWPIAGHGARSLLTFSSDYERGYFIEQMRERGILMNRPNFPTLAHTDLDVNLTLAALAEVKVLVDAIEPGKLVEMVKRVPKTLFKTR